VLFTPLLTWMLIRLKPWYMEVPVDE
jgi:hypothetical protein